MSTADVMGGRADEVMTARTMADITRDFNAGQIGYAEFERQRSQRNLELGTDTDAFYRELAEAPEYMTDDEIDAVAWHEEDRQAGTYGGGNRELEAGG